MSLRLLLLTLLGGLPQTVLAQRIYPPQMKGAEARIYKQVGDVSLKLYVFQPAGHSAEDRRAAIVFFFGGGWKNGNPQQFEQHCRLLAERGMVAITADYRVASRHHTKATECVSDAKSAIRWIRQHAAELGVDARRVAAGGGSAGGHIAASAAVIEGFEAPDEDLKISSRPDALVLFNPALVLADVEGRSLVRESVREGLRERMGTAPRALSPFHHVGPGAPPTLILHGRADSTVPYESAEAFERAMKKAGNRCRLVGYEGAEHGFFNYGRNGSQAFKDTTGEMTAFLAELKYTTLAGKPQTP